jgi:general stress protein YciG
MSVIGAIIVLAVWSMIVLEDKLEGRKRGFAAMHPEKQREIASKGGRSVPADAHAFAKDRQLARAAGSKSRKQRRRRHIGDAPNPPDGGMAIALARLEPPVISTNFRSRQYEERRRPPGAADRPSDRVPAQVLRPCLNSC